MLNIMSVFTISIAILLLFLLIYISLRNKKDHQLRMEGVRAMVKKTKKLKSKRLEQFNEISTSFAIDKSTIESLWITELEFYQNISETICEPNQKSISKVTYQVTKLLTPYYELFKEMSDDSMPDELSSVMDNVDPPTDFKTLEKRYLDKINENEKLQKKILSLKNSSGSSEDSDVVLSNDIGVTELTQLLNQIITELSIKANASAPSDECVTLDELKAFYGTTLSKLDEKLNELDASTEESDKNEALIEQLRQEKVAYLKKYKRAMLILFNTYKEYAGAFGLEAPENPDIEIDDFEKFIEEG